MKLELKENMYVRTKDGYISQYKYYDYDIGEGLIGKLLCIPLSNGTFANIENIKKFSYNIIDVLEVGDYVNGNKVIEIEKNYKFIDGTIRDILWTDTKMQKAIWDETIKSIVTKGQFEQIAYKMEE